MRNRSAPFTLSTYKPPGTVPSVAKHFFGKARCKRAAKTDRQKHARKPLRIKGLRALVSHAVLFPLFFRIVLWFIYALNSTNQDNYDTSFLLMISFIKIVVAEKVAKSPAGSFRVVVGL